MIISKFNLIFVSIQCPIYVIFSTNMKNIISIYLGNMEISTVGNDFGMMMRGMVKGSSVSMIGLWC